MKNFRHTSHRLLIFLFTAFTISFAKAQDEIAHDVFDTSNGKLTVYFIGHGSLLFKYGEQMIYVDPSSREADYTKLPKADLILVTHHHGDHFDMTAINALKDDDTKIILNGKSAENAKGLASEIMKNGDETTFNGINIKAVPAYNLVHMRSENNPYHPKGEGNGYVFTFGGEKVYVAGDTENVPEMAQLKNIDIAFLPMNLPYTMTPEMTADAAKSFRPKILYPYHYGDTDPKKLKELLETENDIEVRIREMQ